MACSRRDRWTWLSRTGEPSCTPRWRSVLPFRHLFALAQNVIGAPQSEIVRSSPDQVVKRRISRIVDQTRCGDEGKYFLKTADLKVEQPLRNIFVLGHELVAE